MNTNEENAQPLTTDPDLLVDMRDVEFVRGSRTLVGPVTWQVELDERWVVIGPNGAGKTTLIRMASAQEFPSAGTVFILGERVGATDMRDLRAAIGVTSSAVAQRVPDDEKVGDLSSPPATPSWAAGGKTTTRWITSKRSRSSSRSARST